MELRTKRKLSFSIIGLYYFYTGWEFGVILPTLWSYLQSYGADEPMYLGFAISGFSVSAALAGLAFGRLSDKFQSHTKTILISSLLLKTLGNLQYTLGMSVTLLIIARCISGLGTSIPALTAEICRVTQPKERTSNISICNSARQVGILVGPAFQLLFSYVNFTIGGLPITPLNAPGLALTIMSTCMVILTFFLFHNMAEGYKELQQHAILIDEEFDSHSDEEDRGRRFNSSIDKSEQDMHEDGAKSNYRKEFCSWTFVVLNVTSFTLLFCQIGIETTVPVIMQKFGYGEFENSLVYMGGGLTALSAFFAIYFLSKKVPDTVFLSIGMFSILFAFLWLLIVFPIDASLVSYLIGVLLVFTGYPLSFVTCKGLSSKYLSDSSQGLGQAIGSMTGFAGLGLGPSWASMTVGTPYLNFGLPILIVLANAIMIATVFKRLCKLEIRN